MTDIAKLNTNMISTPSVKPQAEGGISGSQPGVQKSTGFDELLSKKIQGELVGKALGQNVSQPNGIKFSNHAIERIRSRGIQMGPEVMTKLSEAVDRAEKKGSKETLVLMDNAALIVNIKNKTVVTAMDKNMMKENVFTNIDSTVIL
jgi:flagellar operon protein